MRSREATKSSASEAWSLPVRRRVLVALVAVALGVVVAGFWNYHAVDSFGREAFAEPIAGDTSEAAGAYGSLGPGFGFVFAVAAGLAATFTACNCVVFAMAPGLACNADGSVDRGAVLRSLGVFAGGVVLVGAAYGVFVGMLGPAGIAAVNERAVRLAQARAVFSLLGVVLLAWGVAELGFLERVRGRLSRETRAFLAKPSTRAGAMGVLVGLFAVGRPFPVFREFLTYAAHAQSPLYGAAVMVVHGLGMILVMVLLLVLMVRLAGDRLTAWVQRDPEGPRVVSGFALLAGGAYFLFYWGLAFAFNVGGWGWKLGLYG